MKKDLNITLQSEYWESNPRSHKDREANRTRTSDVISHKLYENTVPIQLSNEQLTFKSTRFPIYDVTYSVPGSGDWCFIFGLVSSILRHLVSCSFRWESIVQVNIAYNHITRHIPAWSRSQNGNLFLVKVLLQRDICFCPFTTHFSLLES